MLRLRKPAAEGPDAASMNRQQKKMAAKMEEKKAKKVPVVTEPSVPPEIRRRNMVRCDPLSHTL